LFEIEQVARRRPVVTMSEIVETHDCDIDAMGSRG